MNHGNNGEVKPSLKEFFKDDFYIGVALSQSQLEGKDPMGLAIAERHFNSIVPENSLKWEVVHPEPDRYNFEPADLFVAFGKKNNMFMVGHTLVWFSQTPGWVFKDERGMPPAREALLKRMKDHIFTVMGRYKGQIQAWDVANEAIDANGDFRKNRWLEIIGKDYLQKAYEYAREADPSAQLYYNDYDFEKPEKCEGVIRLIRDLQSKGIRIDGVGIQGHWFVEYPPIEEIEKLIVKLSQLGVKLMVTEMDVSVLPFYPVDSQAIDLASLNPETQKRLNSYADGLPDSVHKDLANRYAELFSLFHKHRDKFNRITFWAVHDAQSWRNYQPIRGRTDHPMLFDREGKAKPAFDAIFHVMN